MKWKKVRNKGEGRYLQQGKDTSNHIASSNNNLSKVYIRVHKPFPPQLTLDISLQVLAQIVLSGHKILGETDFFLIPDRKATSTRVSSLQPADQIWPLKRLNSACELIHVLLKLL
ncbi:hypothetical protein Y1Q_0020633 [Alligator mississippiensis]|uniref:Uncharacterized protein n=1 Tax=Alligator mississippiensis TaxID=8496 RepID=A0A151NI10_ALLMI|nr:hypothetical protein Y1Q_0020633 [Alligator mississippiensis]